jgi:hypothetical protein
MKDRENALEDFELHLRSGMLQCASIALHRFQWRYFLVLALPFFFRYLRLYSECPGLYPKSYGHNLTVQDNRYACSVLQYDIREIGTYWIAVEGVDNQEGTFEIALTCSNGTDSFSLWDSLCLFIFCSTPSCLSPQIIFLCFVHVFLFYQCLPQSPRHGHRYCRLQSRLLAQACLLRQRPRSRHQPCQPMRLH